MEEEQAKELLTTVVEYLQSEEGNLTGAVDLAVNFSARNSIPSDFLLALSNFCGSNEAYELAYVFAETAAVLSQGSIKADAHFNAGLASVLMRRNEKAEEQYKLALEADPNDAITHSNYGILLSDTGRNEEAEEQLKVAIELDPEEPNSHGAYGLLLLSKNLELKAIEETEIASRLFGDNGNRVKEHLSLAWLYEEFANKYYNLENYQKRQSLLQKIIRSATHVLFQSYVFRKCLTK